VGGRTWAVHPSAIVTVTPVALDVAIHNGQVRVFRAGDPLATVCEPWLGSGTLDAVKKEGICGRKSCDRRVTRQSKDD